MANDEKKNQKDTDQPENTKTSEMKSARPDSSAGSSEKTARTDSGDAQQKGEDSKTVGMDKVQSSRQEPAAAKPEGDEGKSSTSQLKVVQEKKKELENRMKSEGTIRLRQPTSGSRAQQVTGGGGAQDAGTSEAGGAAKRTLKIKSGDTAASSQGTTRGAGQEPSGGARQQSPAAAGPVGALPPAEAPSGLALTANVVSCLASGLAFTFLLLYYLDLYM